MTSRLFVEYQSIDKQKVAQETAVNDNRGQRGRQRGEKYRKIEVCNCRQTLLLC